jgi:outer membrane lipoprotein-sorting protein
MSRHFILRLILLCVLALLPAAYAGGKPAHSQRAAGTSPNIGSEQTASTPAQPEAAAHPSHADPLERTLRSMDENAAKFRNAKANFVWITHNGVVDEDEEPDKGAIYFRRKGSQIEMAADVLPPDAKQIIFANGKIEVYQPKTGVVDIYDTNAHREEIETFLVLGFGSSGQDLSKSFSVKYAGEDKIDGAETVKLELTPLAKNVRDRFPTIDLWIDPSRGVSLRQKLFQTGGDYRTADYSEIEVNQKVPESVFKLKTSRKTKTVTH